MEPVGVAGLDGRRGPAAGCVECRVDGTAADSRCACGNGCRSSVEKEEGMDDDNNSSAAGRINGQCEISVDKKIARFYKKLLQ